MVRAISGALAGLLTTWLIVRYRGDVELAVAAGAFIAVTVWFRPYGMAGGRRC